MLEGLKKKNRYQIIKTKHALESGQTPIIIGRPGTGTSFVADTVLDSIHPPRNVFKVEDLGRFIQQDNFNQVIEFNKENGALVVMIAQSLRQVNDSFINNDEFVIVGM